MEVQPISGVNSVRQNDRPISIAPPEAIQPAFEPGDDSYTSGDQAAERGLEDSEDGDPDSEGEEVPNVNLFA